MSKKVGGIPSFRYVANGLGAVVLLSEPRHFSPSRGEIPDMKSPRILVVDDSEVGRNLLLGQLAFLHLDAESAESGAQAVQLAATGRFDLILMDIFMPEIDGLEATSRIRALQRRGVRACPIIAVTGGADKHTCITGGLDDFVNKPILLDDLKRVLARWLPSTMYTVDGQLNSTA